MWTTPSSLTTEPTAKLCGPFSALCRPAGPRWRWPRGARRAAWPMMVLSSTSTASSPAASWTPWGPGTATSPAFSLDFCVERASPTAWPWAPRAAVQWSVVTGFRLHSYPLSPGGARFPTKIPRPSPFGLGLGIFAYLATGPCALMRAECGRCPDPFPRRPGNGRAGPPR